MRKFPDVEERMRGLMMDFPLTLVHILERAGKIFGDVEIVSRRPDGRLMRVHLRRFLPARQETGAGAGISRAEARRPRGDAVVEPLFASGMLFRNSGGGRSDAHAESSAASG